MGFKVEDHFLGFLAEEILQKGDFDFSGFFSAQDLIDLIAVEGPYRLIVEFGHDSPGLQSERRRITNLG
jgi:hypothetical protein